MTGRFRRRALVVTAAAALVAGLGLSPAAAKTDADKGAPQGPTMDIQMLAVNDVHGNLEPPAGSSGTITRRKPDGTTEQVPAGGVEYLATHLKNARAGQRNTVTVGAGDLIGGTPLLSAAFHDEPTIQSLDKLGLDVSAVGNHEFDEGRTELERIQKGGCHPTDGCQGDPYKGAKFKYLAANVVDKKTRVPMLPPFWVKNFNGARVGFIGMTLKGTPDIVTREGIKTLDFLDEVKTANSYVPWLRLFGVKSIVVLLHEGGLPASNIYDYDCNAGGPGKGISGPIVDIAKRLDPEIDALVTGHTHQPYACNIPDPKGQSRLVTSASSFGRIYTDIRMTYDRRTHDIVRTSVAGTNKIVTRDVPKDADQTALITKYKELVAPIANKVVGKITADIPGRGAGRPESPLGDVIADSQLEATKAAGSKIAFMNPGGIRSDLAYAQSGSEGDGVVTYGEAFTVQPFNNFVATMDLTGAQIVTLLQQQYSGPNAGTGEKTLQVSRGFTYTVDRSKTGADKIVASSIKLDGVALDPAATYKITVNNFLADGGDNFAVLREGKNKVVGGLDIDAFTAYLTAKSPLAPPAADRITFIN